VNRTSQKAFTHSGRADYIGTGPNEQKFTRHFSRERSPAAYRLPDHVLRLTSKIV
jgi:hypothetical protein